MKKHWLIFMLMSACIFFVACSKDSGPKEKLTKSDSLAIVHSDKSIVYKKYESELQKEVQTMESQSYKMMIKPQPKEINPEGSLVYYCPRRMLENSDNNVSVVITKATLTKAIADLEKRIAATGNEPAELIHQNTSGSTITLAQKMKVELLFDNESFSTIYRPKNDDQLFDGTKDMTWDWIIKPLKVGPAHLSIIVSAYDDKNARWVEAQTPPKIFDIQVQVDPRSYLAKLWGFLGTNPEWIFTQLFFPLIAFFYGKKQGKKKTD